LNFKVGSLGLYFIKKRILVRGVRKLTIEIEIAKIEEKVSP
jgi:hypothetical protein